MADNHPMKPTEDQIREWARFDCTDLTPEGLWRRIAHAAYSAGADAELEACVEWVQGYAECGDSLRAARRPKPPSLANEALRALGSPAKIGESRIIEHGEHKAIRRALERLAELEVAQTSPRENI